MAHGANQREPRVLFSVKNDRHQTPAVPFVLFISTRSTTGRSVSAILPEATVSFDAREGPLSSREGCCRCLGLLRMPLQGRFALGGLLNKWRRGLAGGGVKVNVWPTFEGSVHDGWIRER